MLGGMPSTSAWYFWFAALRRQSAASNA